MLQYKKVQQTITQTICVYYCDFCKKEVPNIYSCDVCEFYCCDECLGKKTEDRFNDDYPYRYICKSCNEVGKKYEDKIKNLKEEADVLEDTWYKEAKEKAKKNVDGL